MGNDGGSIPDRRDLVRNKPKAEQADKANQTRAKWLFCALSKRKLQEPIVSCDLGKLYNKDAVIEYLLDKTAFGDGEDICGHIRSLKDVKTLKLTPNPTATNDSPQFICPLTLKEMNGLQPFVYLRTSGAVFTQAGLRNVSSSSSDDDEMDMCPVTGTKYNRKTDVMLINPGIEEEEKMRAAMDAKRLAEPVKAKKSSKKRKAAEEQEQEEEKAGKKKARPVQTMNPSMTSAVTNSLAKMAEERNKPGAMSAAVKELYNGSGPKRKETFMTMGTFTRYA